MVHRLPLDRSSLCDHFGAGIVAIGAVLEEVEGKAVLPGASRQLSLGRASNFSSDEQQLW
jgi:hypothetical protein